jgi:hypothetical protein
VGIKEVHQDFEMEKGASADLRLSSFPRPSDEGLGFTRARKARRIHRDSSNETDIQGKKSRQSDEEMQRIFRNLSGISGWQAFR